MLRSHHTITNYQPITNNGSELAELQAQKLYFMHSTPQQPRIDIHFVCKKTHLKRQILSYKNSSDITVLYIPCEERKAVGGTQLAPPNTCCLQKSTEGAETRPVIRHKNREQKCAVFINCFPPSHCTQTVGWVLCRSAGRTHMSHQNWSRGGTIL